MYVGLVLSVTGTGLTTTGLDRHTKKLMDTYALRAFILMEKMPQILLYKSLLKQKLINLIMLANANAMGIYGCTQCRLTIINPIIH